MNCKNFQHWLSTRQTHKEPSVQDIFYAHMQTCAECKELYLLDIGLEKTIETSFKLQNVPNNIHENIELTLNHATAPTFISWYKIAGTLAVCALIIFIVFTQFFNPPFRYQNLQQLSEKAIASHLKGNTTMSFSSKEIEKAVIMLSRELKFKVILPDLTDQGYVLLGGRLCALGKCKIAYLFYEKENKISSLVIMDYDHLNFKMADGSRFSNDIKGYHTDIWKEKYQVYAMVY